MSAKLEPFGIHWFRRDLRISGNPALQRNHSEMKGRTLGLFVLDEEFLGRDDFSKNRFSFFLSTLAQLQESLRARGGDLLVLQGGPVRAFSQIRASLKQHPSIVTWNRDYEPFARERDQKITDLLSVKWHWPIRTERDHLIAEPGEVLREDGKAPLKVFGAFFRRWEKLVFSHNNVERCRNSFQDVELFCVLWKHVMDLRFVADHKSLESWREENPPDVVLPPAGETAAQRSLRAFKKRIVAYSDERDVVAKRSSSGFSVYLKNGSLSSSQVIEFLSLGRPETAMTAGERSFLKELVWREFFYSILYHWPNTEHESFREEYRTLKWRRSKRDFEAWKIGMTGYPIVDAAMRELARTGLVGNRARMVVASFLTKHLLIDWRWGAKYFMQTLLDGDLAANAGGWQWAASTGCDSQPYFRIFNPVLQSQKFDPHGEYLRRYVPELAHLSDREIHFPSPKRRGEYPRQIVEPSAARLRALRLFRQPGPN